MKNKITAVILAIVLTLSMCACGSSKAETTAAAETTPAAETTEESTKETKESSEAEAESTETSSAAESGSAAGTTAAAAADTGVDEAAMQLYQDAMNKTAGAGAMDTTTQMEMTAGDQTVVINMNMTTIPNGEDGQLAAKGTLSSNGISADVEYYYSDGFYYTSTMGQKQKAASTYAEAVANSNMADAFTLGDIDNNSFDRMTAQKQADGTTLITASFSVNEKTETANGTVEVVVDKDGYAISQKVQLQDRSIENNEEVNTSVDMTLTVNAYGDKVQITLPDFSEYEETTAAAESAQ